MQIYQYIGKNAEGKVERGLVPGDSMESVAKKLAAKGVHVEQIGLAESHDPLTEVSRPQARPSLPSEIADAVAKKVSLEELQFFFMQFGTMLNAGISVSDALNTLSGQARSGALKQALLESRNITVTGGPLSEGFARHPEVFSPLMMAMMRTGERGGFLADQCKHMSEYLRREIELRNMIRKETAYPKIVIGFSIVVIVLANSVIAVFGHEGAQKIYSPLTTPANWIVIGPVVVILWYYFKVVLRRPEAKYKWDRGVLTIPYIGPTSHGFAMAKFGRSYAALFRAGVAPAESIQLAADACGNEFLRAQIYPAASALESGEGVTNAFARTGAFTPMVLDMARTGETTGDIDSMLNKIAEYYEDEGSVRARQAAVVLGIVVFVLVALYVLYILFRFYSEYFNKQMGSGEI